MQTIEELEQQQEANRILAIEHAEQIGIAVADRIYEALQKGLISPEGRPTPLPINRSKK